MIFAVTHLSNWVYGSKTYYYATHNRQKAIDFFQKLWEERGSVDPIVGFGTAIKIPTSSCGNHGFRIEILHWHEFDYHGLELDKQLRPIPLGDMED